MHKADVEDLINEYKLVCKSESPVANLISAGKHNDMFQIFPSLCGQESIQLTEKGVHEAPILLKRYEEKLDRMAEPVMSYAESSSRLKKASNESIKRGH